MLSVGLRTGSFYYYLAPGEEVHTFVISLHLHLELRMRYKSTEQEIYFFIYFDVNIFQ